MRGANCTSLKWKGNCTNFINRVCGVPSKDCKQKGVQVNRFIRAKTISSILRSYDRWHGCGICHCGVESVIMINLLCMLV